MTAVAVVFWVAVGFGVGPDQAYLALWLLDGPKCHPTDTGRAKDVVVKPKVMRPGD